MGRNNYQNALDFKRQNEIKKLWSTPKAVISIFLILAVLAFFVAAIGYAIALLAASGLMLYDFFREFSIPAEIYKNGEIYKAKVIKKTPKSGSAFASYKTNFTVTFINAEGEKISSKFTQYSESFAPKYNKKKYSLPNVGDEILIYYYYKYPDLCCPDTFQFFSLGE